MSFNLQAAGTREQVLAQIAAAPVYGDTTHVDLVKQFIVAQVDLAVFDRGLFVEASGHHEVGWASLSLSIRPLALPAETADAPSDQAAEG